jgi:hypothetical protein
MGTAGQHMPQTPPTLPYATKTRFNVTQSVDSSGPILIIMMKEYDKTVASSDTIESKHHYSQVETDIAEAQRVVKKKEEDKKTLTTTETVTYNDAISRITFNGEKKWNEYYRSHPNWKKSVTEYFQQTIPARNFSYDFWIQTGIRWLFEKRKGVSTWEEAIRAYNGTGAGATDYKGDVTTRSKLAKEAQKNKTKFVPKEDY